MLLDNFPTDFTYNVTEEPTAESTVGTAESTVGTAESTVGTVESTAGTVESVIEEKIDDDYRWKQFDMNVKNLVVKDCKPDGNCQFRSIEQALYQYNNKYTHIKLRKLIGDYILSLKDKDFENILNNYKIFLLSLFTYFKIKFI